MNRLLLCLLVSAELVLLLALGSCIDRYTPDVPAAAQASLVVDGYLNPVGSTVIKLSRSFSINTKSAVPAETRAQVAIQDEAGQRYGLTESAGGTYTSAALTLDPARQYQLRITTAQGREYASDLVPAIITPPIDSLTWQANSLSGVQLFVSAHSASTVARYYRWDYDETWQFTSAYKSELEYVASTNTIEPRPAAHQIYTCWRTEPSTTIIQGNTTQFNQNTLDRYPLIVMPSSFKFHYGYSILVRQVAEAQAEYEYWERLRKNTENLGTVNDPLPTRVTGNVHALADPTEVVLGYVGAHSVTEKRLFIDAGQLPVPRPGGILYDPFYAVCTHLGELLPPFALQQSKDGFVVPVTASYDVSGSALLYYVSFTACVDCRERGTSVKPNFWP